MRLGGDQTLVSESGIMLKICTYIASQTGNPFNTLRPTPIKIGGTIQHQVPILLYRKSRSTALILLFNARNSASASPVLEEFS